MRPAIALAFIIVPILQGSTINAIEPTTNCVIALDFCTVSIPFDAPGEPYYQGIFAFQEELDTLQQEFGIGKVNYWFTPGPNDVPSGAVFAVPYSPALNDPPSDPPNDPPSPAPEPGSAVLFGIGAALILARRVTLRA